MNEYEHTCPRCRGGSTTPGLCRGCRYIRDTWGTTLDRAARPARGLKGLREALGVPE